MFNIFVYEKETSNEIILLNIFRFIFFYKESLIIIRYSVYNNYNNYVLNIFKNINFKKLLL